ncbi:MAG: SAM-dependent methyltransferase [Burkholderiales bacterium]|jgi:SAM-dependent MidA family methyltransferase|nr:SAM-dependent methyltransferase [Burkholderiales bacterium]
MNDHPLPLRDADSQERTAAMTKFLVDKMIKCGGFLPLRDYIDAVLYTPGLGYYESQSIIFGHGTRDDGGDFITSSELTPLFARTWASPIAANLPIAPFIWEFGGGSGRFCADLMTELEARQALPKRYYMIEKSATLKQRQRDTLKRDIPHLFALIEWVDDLPAVMEGSVFLNEVLDAVPPHVFVRHHQQWFVQGVLFTNHTFTLDQRPLTDPAMIALCQSRAPLNEADCVVEINTDAQHLVTRIARAMSASHTGAPLYICDYGFERHDTIPERYLKGTLRAFYRHRLTDNVLAMPGLIDITAHVDFLSVLEAAQEGGLQLETFCSQKEWLIRHGILDHLLTLTRDHPNQSAQGSRAVQTLISPEAMGDIFKVLVLRDGFGKK